MADVISSLERLRYQPLFSHLQHITSPAPLDAGHYLKSARRLAAVVTWQRERDDPAA